MSDHDCRTICFVEPDSYECVTCGAHLAPDEVHAAIWSDIVWRKWGRGPRRASRPRGKVRKARRKDRA